MQTFLEKMKHEWTVLISRTEKRVLTLSQKLATKNASAISKRFYDTVLTDPQAEEFLTNEQVERHLKKALAKWVTEVLSGTTENVDQLIAMQQHVGQMHARIGIPVQVVEMGARVLKKFLFPLINDMECSAEEKFKLHGFTTESIDIAMEVMSRTFSFSDTQSSREDENYRVFSLLENAEEEKERQISSLLAWEVEIVYKIMLDAEVCSIQSFSRSEFGLWFNHKGRHYFSGLTGISSISKLMLELDEFVQSIKNESKSPSKKQKLINYVLQVHNSLSQITTLLRDLFDDVSRHEIGMDVLTRLLNRRFLPTIFKREIVHANRAGCPLSVLIIDIDYFKEINDGYGHNIGDELLRKVSQAFYDSVRSSDYVFRYGGDEFLIVLTEVSETETLRLAERIRSKVEKQAVNTPDGSLLSVSLSIGAAMFNGHPDYERLIQSADEALYRAKSLGRNRVELWRPHSNTADKDR
ncbi:putative heme-regulated two-component response regulator [Trabulsiella guamensis ATCC 49490]|uniref:Diguanylate cyclase DosC n=1 Tax=Trabulsiella guamensis ATCC 49490 TaxID=1005994 RepID=A0A084ZPD5_9ENTR|nr:diguanylate cyclase [Trabulsiella guamensis]KFB99329.1 putative heme-regulated two-component response regulator [Trabulsiella guamensis ATCC 49490]